MLKKKIQRAWQILKNLSYPHSLFLPHLLGLCKRTARAREKKIENAPLFIVAPLADMSPAQSGVLLTLKCISLRCRPSGLIKNDCDHWSVAAPYLGDAAARTLCVKITSVCGAPPFYLPPSLRIYGLQPWRRLPSLVRRLGAEKLLPMSQIDAGVRVSNSSCRPR